MEPLWPDPADKPARRPCARCHHPTRVDRLIEGFGPECAALLGLTVATPRVRADPQTGPDLLDHLNGDHDDDDEPGDHCDGWDR